MPPRDAALDVIAGGIGWITKLDCNSAMWDSEGTVASNRLRILVRNGSETLKVFVRYSCLVHVNVNSGCEERGRLLLPFSVWLMGNKFSCKV